MRPFIQTFACILLASGLAACGGGGGGGDTSGNSNSSSGGGSSTNTVTVVPALGAFSANATVEVFDAATGNRLGSPTTTGSSGTATLNLGNQATSFVIRVSGASSGVTYYDEASGADLPMLAGQSLLAMVPTSVALTGDTRIGVTPLTHMAAAFAGLTSTNLKVIPASVNDTVPVTIAKAYARVRYAMGLGNVNTSLEPYLNPLLAPTVLSSSNRARGIDLSTQGGYYGVLLAEMARAGANSTSRYSPLEFAQALATEAASLVSSNYSPAALNSFTASEPRLVLASATNTLGAGNSTYINTCVTIPSETRTRMNNAMFNAYGITDLSSSVDQLAQTILTQTRQQLSGTVSNMTATPVTGNGCS